MSGIFKRLFRHYDYSLVLTAVLLCTISLVMVYSSSMVVAVMRYEATSDYFFERQLMWVVLALIVYLIAMLFPYKAYQKLVKPLTLGCIVMLALVLVAGNVSNNAQSWLSIGGVSIQPAEAVKLGLIIYLASVFSNKQGYIANFKTGVVPPLIVITLIFLLIALQPDLGTAMIVAGTASTIIICSGMRFKHLMMLLGLAGSMLTVIFLFLLTPEQASRFSVAYQPFDNPTGDGWQLINSYIAIASGGLTGKGLGQSIQKAGFLPEPHTDFIMAIIAEELGLFGVIIVLGLLGYMVFRGFLIGMKCQDTFGSLLAVGVSGLIAVQTIVNLGSLTGLLPLTGVPLPLISYGGSSLLVLMFAQGILVNISAFVKIQEKKKATQQPEKSVV